MGDSRSLTLCKAKLSEAEEVIENCEKALELVPVSALEKDMQWIPSIVALHLLRKAKESIRDFNAVHHRSGREI